MGSRDLPLREEAAQEEARWRLTYGGGERGGCTSLRQDAPGYHEIVHSHPHSRSDPARAPLSQREQRKSRGREGEREKKMCLYSCSV